MDQFKTLLKSFVKGEADLSDLTHAINRLDIEDPAAAEEARLNCESLFEKVDAATRVDSRFKQKIASDEAETVVSSSTPTLIQKTVQVDPTVTQQKTRIRTQSDNSQTILSSEGKKRKARNILEIGSKLKDRFILVEELGRGGMGVVYKARDFRKEETLDNEPFVAIKVLSKEFQEIKMSVIALQRETKKAQKLAHPNIITVFDFDRDGNNVFMTMEYLEGQPLDAIIKKTPGKPVDQKLALSIIEQMGRALSYAHKGGIVHSDLKPGNVFLTKSGVVKVLDFGIARAAKLDDPQHKQDKVFDAGDFQALTPVYASKEMLEGKDPDPRDDIYGLAIVASLLLTGHHPFHRFPATKAHAAGFKPHHIDKLPRSIRYALSHALEFERDKRTASANEFLQELNLRPRRKRSLKRRLFEFTIISLIIIASVFTVVRLSDSGKPVVVLEDTTSISDPNIRQKVENLLEIADVHMMVNRLMDPPGSSAFYAYQQILELHSNNKQAMDGLRHIADYYEKQARESFIKGDNEKALLLVEKGLQAFPSHEGLEILKDEIPKQQ
jgi:serine/threonine protein kinase